MPLAACSSDHTEEAGSPSDQPCQLTLGLFLLTQEHLQTCYLLWASQASSGLCRRVPRYNRTTLSRQLWCCCSPAWNPAPRPLRGWLESHTGTQQSDPHCTGPSAETASATWPVFRAELHLQHWNKPGAPHTHPTTELELPMEHGLLQRPAPWPARGRAQWSGREKQTVAGPMQILAYEVGTEETSLMGLNPELFHSELTEGCSQFLIPAGQLSPPVALQFIHPLLESREPREAMRPGGRQNTPGLGTARGKRDGLSRPGSISKAGREAAQEPAGSSSPAGTSLSQDPRIPPAARGSPGETPRMTCQASPDPAALGNKVPLNQ